MEKVMSTAEAVAEQIVTEEQVLAALGLVQDPDLHKDLVTLKMIKNVKICEGISPSSRADDPCLPFKGKDRGRLP
jgi:ATP-binding protein involved in chromosome partitioning